MNIVHENESDQLHVSGTAGKLGGSIAVPGDKSISHRALMLGALAKGRSNISGLSSGHDVAATAEAVGRLGAKVVNNSDGTISVSGGNLTEPDEPIFLGNSGTGLRLLMGLCATVEGLSVLTGDASLNSRPIARIVKPLSLMGVEMFGRNNSTTAPVAIVGKAELKAINYQSPVASAQVKSAILIAGLRADGPTTVVEPALSRPHTEEMFTEAGVEVVVKPEPSRSEAAVSITINPTELKPFENFSVPGDPSQAAFWVCWAAATPGAELSVTNVYCSPLRTRFTEVLRRMGANVEVDQTSKTISVEGARLKGTTIAGSEIVSVIDEIPALAVAASLAEGETVVSDAAELRVKESDRIAAIESEFTKFGVNIKSSSDGFRLEGLAGKHPKPSTEPLLVDPHMDHRIAMSTALLAAGLAQPATISGWSIVGSSYPNFVETLVALTA